MQVGMPVLNFEIFIFSLKMIMLVTCHMLKKTFRRKGNTALASANYTAKIPPIVSALNKVNALSIFVGLSQISQSESSDPAKIIEKFNPKRS